MYLKEIRAHGFKSFADKINIELSNCITGIVGPNGSGKSNVVDAVRWVLGEQSVKSLRGSDNMTDVIFSGSKSRNALNVASVTLVFDNNDNYLPVAFNEVSIKRRVYKDGTNEYFLNGEKCRLKDITDILLDSGMAKESFNIISQGKIEEILSNKPQDRRIIFEEAAGVLKYKRRKEEALRKLDKTHDNMNRIDDIIHELEEQVLPLKEQKEKAIEYLEVKEDLENIEISLIANDITSINNLYKKEKLRIEILTNELSNITASNSGNEAKISKYKLDLDNINSQISLKQKELLEITSKVEKINARKTVVLERQKYQVEDTKLHNNIVELNEKILKISNDLANTVSIVDNKQKELDLVLLKYQKQENVIISLKDKRKNLENNLFINFRKQNSLKSKIESLRESIENNSSIPSAVRSVLNNPKLVGIHNIIGSIIEVDDKYATAISTTLGQSSSNIVVDNENAAKEAITYLKNNNLGRATFFPINVIKPRAIEPDVENALKSINGYVNIASNLVSYDQKYYGIVLNQLGNVIVAKDIDSANLISKKTNYRYRIVTVDGEIIHVGGSLTGGNIKTRNVISLKYELEDALKEYSNLLETIKLEEDNINITDNNLKGEEDKLYLFNKEKVSLSDELFNKKGNIYNLTSLLEDTKLELGSTNNMINNALTSEEETIINEYYAASKDKENITLELNTFIKSRDNIKDEIDEFEFKIKGENTLFNDKNKELKELEINVNRMDVKLDNLLNTLSETYNMTYEKAVSNYRLDMDEDIARNKVSNLKRKLKEIGIVNVGAIEEYNRVSERYEFLIKQREDLTNAENTLLEIIEEMDLVMMKEFNKTFEIIKTNFTETFQQLFNGGFAELKLTEPNNLLETGIDIIASPPGKKLTTISLLSGGEKTLTAISLLFAILKSRDVPFCILDEVEAALDDVNVNSFGNYLQKLQEKTQFIVITHKKKTMEFVNNLYGITMQESGVSKLVSVKLEELK